MSSPGPSLASPILLLPRSDQNRGLEIHFRLLYQKMLTAPCLPYSVLSGKIDALVKYSVLAGNPSRRDKSVLAKYLFTH